MELSDPIFFHLQVTNEKPSQALPLPEETETKRNADKTCKKGVK